MALSANKDIERKEGLIQAFLVMNNVHIYKGALVSVNATGYAIPAADTAGTRFIGEAYEECDTTLTGYTSTPGLKIIRVRRTGVMRVVATSITQVMIGQRMFIKDDATVDDASSNYIPCGILVGFEDTDDGWIDISPAVRQQCTRTEIILVPAHAQYLEALGWDNVADGVFLTNTISDKDAYIPVPGLKEGDIILKVHMHGGIGAESGKATVLDCKLVKVVAAAGGKTESNVQIMDQLSKTADFLVNVEKAVAGTPTVAHGDAFWFFITGTTNDQATNDIIVTGLEVEVTRAYPD